MNMYIFYNVKKNIKFSIGIVFIQIWNIGNFLKILLEYS